MTASYTTKKRYADGPLGDLRVLELTDEKGQWCGKLMADFGADVIKIEPPKGAPERHIGPFYQDIPHPERSLHFWHYNTSKRGVTLNLETEDGRELFRRLVPTTDVIIETFQPGYLPSLGLGYDQLKELNPRLIMCSLTPFGQTGPWRDFRSSDLLHLAAGGQMACCGYDEVDDPDQIPIAPGGGNAWHIGSHYAYIAITTALCFRDVSGKGQYIDANVHGACALTTEMHINSWIYTKRIVLRQTGRHAGVQRSGKSQYRTKDGKYLNGGIGGQPLPNDRWKVVVDWIASYGLAQDLTDPQYDTAEYRQANQAHILAVWENFVANLTQEEAFHGGQERGFAWGAIRAPEEVYAEPHFHDRGFWTEVEHPELGKTFDYPGAAAIYPKSPWKIYRRAPLLGEHNQEVFGELGLTRRDLVVLREARVI